MLALSDAQKRIFPKPVYSKYKVKLITVKPVDDDYGPELDRFFGYKYFTIGDQMLRIREDNFSNVLTT